MRRVLKLLLSPVNGVKGAISLFMAVLMTPFLSIAMLLVETGRYNSAVSILDDAMGVTSVSTLANYDTFLQERWGLMALSQDEDLTDLYSGYLGTNSAILGNSISVDSVKVDGLYGLGDVSVLKHQILEYGKYNVPMTLVNNFGNLDTLISQFEKIGNFGSYVSVFSSAANALDSGITLVENAETLKELANTLDDLKTRQESLYVDFERKVNTLIDTLIRIKNLEDSEAELQATLKTLNEELQELREQSGTGSTDAEDTSNDAIKEKEDEVAETERALRSVQDELRRLRNEIPNLRQKAETAKTEYAQLLDEIATTLKDYQSAMSKCTEAIKSIQGDITSSITSIATITTNIAEERKTLSELKKDLAEKEKLGYDESDSSYQAGLEYKISLEEKVAKMEAELAILEAGSAGLSSLTDGLNTTLQTYSDTTIGEIAKSFEKMAGKVREINISAINSNSPRITREGYMYVTVAGYVSAEDIDEYLKEQEDELKQGTLKAILDSMKAVYNKLMGFNLFFEDNLNANLNTEYYQALNGGLKNVQEGNLLFDAINSIAGTLGALMMLQQKLMTLDLLGIYNELKALCDSVKNMFNALGRLALNFAQVFTEHRLIYCTYAAFNLPCRTDCSETASTKVVSMKTMTGSSVSTMQLSGSTWRSGSLPVIHQKANVPLFGEIAAIIDMIKQNNNGGGQDLAFCGAELEYILYGSNSEIVNQLYVFLALYLIRILCCIPAISSNIEVQALAASATFGYPVVMGLYYILEPLVETILLTNGVAQKVIPSSVYLAPSGIPGLVSSLISFCRLTDADAKSIENAMSGAISKSKEDYTYQKKLREYENHTGGSSAQPIGNVERKTQSTTEEAWTNYKKSFFTFEYREYCYILMLLTVDETELLNRLYNVIQTETHYYYTRQESTFAFDLDKAYTNMAVTVEARVNQMLPSLLDSSKFSITREQYRGY